MRSAKLPRVFSSSRFCPKPHVEGNNIYRHCGLHDILREFKRPINSQDVTPASINRYLDVIRAHLKFHHRPRFIHKNTNNSLRIPYLNELFPDAKFIHIIRDGQAAAMSLCHVDFWDNMPLWWDGRTTKEYLREGEDPLVLAGRHWQKTVMAARSTAKDLPSTRYMELKYEDFVSQPAEKMNQMQTFCELVPDSAFQIELHHNPVKNLNQRWSDSFSDQAIRRLDEQIRKTRQLLSYE